MFLFLVIKIWKFFWNWKKNYFLIFSTFWYKSVVFNIYIFFFCFSFFIRPPRFALIVQLSPRKGELCEFRNGTSAFALRSALVRYKRQVSRDLRSSPPNENPPTHTTQFPQSKEHSKSPHQRWPMATSGLIASNLHPVDIKFFIPLKAYGKRSDCHRQASC